MRIGELRELYQRMEADGIMTDPSAVATYIIAIARLGELAEADQLLIDAEKKFGAKAAVFAHTEVLASYADRVRICVDVLF